RWNNGHVIVEMLPPISTEGHGKEGIRELANICREQMKEKLESLDEEVKQRNAA
ncbi:1-acyl-sn-glycerol-3-phosphate acyltransferase, partial [Vibrio parahaemolyticus]|nr:1-acyl-sn-glycerol-3-phosphate acyltransferase [Vibrio parahaemolyticus]